MKGLRLGRPEIWVCEGEDQERALVSQSRFSHSINFFDPAHAPALPLWRANNRLPWQICPLSPY